jgi:hypothetical protein
MERHLCLVKTTIVDDQGVDRIVAPRNVGTKPPSNADVTHRKAPPYAERYEGMRREC